jgi:hypothetical protein
MLKESLKAPLFTDGFRLSDLLCQSYPPHVWSGALRLAPEKSDLERPSVRPAMCERSPLGLPHTQNRMSGRPRVAEILLMSSPKTLRVCGDLKTVCVLLLQDLLQNCSRGGRRRVEDMCYERRRAEACVDESAHHALVNAGGREIV